MKTNRLINIFTVAFGFAAFSTAGCTKEDNIAATPAPPAKDTVVAPVTTVVPAPAITVQVPVAASPDVASAQWSTIKDATYDTRADFFVGLKALEARVNDQINELTAKRGAMTSTANTKDWDFAMKEMGDSRAYLKDMGDELRKASPENWNEDKDRVGQAWVRTQEAYDKVKHSTTT